MCLQTSLKPFIFLCLCPLEQGLHFFTVFPWESSFEKTQKGLFLRCGCGNTLLTLLKTPPHTLPFPPPPIRSILGTTVTLGKWQGKCYIQGDRYFKASQLCRKYNATENFGKLSSDRNLQCDRQILCFYSSLHSWQLFVGAGRVKRAANPRNWAAKFLVVSAPFSLLFHRSLSPGRSGGGTNIEKSFFTLPQSLLAS